MSKLLTLLVGPPGSGKTTYAKNLIHNDGDHGLATVYVNQDSQGKGHLKIFDMAILDNKDIIVDRMGFSKFQRNRYLDIAKENGYKTKIVVLHESYYTCFNRVMVRKDHETIKDEVSARSALNTFFTKYERVTDDEADTVTRIWPEGEKPHVICVDLDGTLCNVEHRRHFIRKPKGIKKDWHGFFKGMVDDTPNKWCDELVKKMSKDYIIVYCSGRPDSWRPHTVEWLKKYGHFDLGNDFHLYMRPRHDNRDDTIVKEIILDFEILTRFTPFFMIDDRNRIVDMWRKRGYICLQCDEGNF